MTKASDFTHLNMIAINEIVCQCFNKWCEKLNSTVIRVICLFDWNIIQAYKLIFEEETIHNIMFKNNFSDKIVLKCVMIIFLNEAVFINFIFHQMSSNIRLHNT